MKNEKLTYSGSDIENNKINAIDSDAKKTVVGTLNQVKEINQKTLEFANQRIVDMDSLFEFSEGYETLPTEEYESTHIKSKKKMKDEFEFNLSEDLKKTIKLKINFNTKFNVIIDSVGVGPSGNLILSGVLEEKGIMIPEEEELGSLSYSFDRSHIDLYLP